MTWRRAGAALTTGVAAIQLYRFRSYERSEWHSISSSVQQFLTFEAMRVASTAARSLHDRDCKKFNAIQAEVLNTRLSENASTVFGRDHDFAAILASENTMDAFRERHPITTPETYKPYVDRIVKGDVAVINSEKETMLGATSGTSGTRNLVPYTPTMAKTFFVRGILVVFETLRRSIPDALALQKTCKLAFAANWSETANGLRIGPASSGPKDKSFQRLLHLYSTPAAGYTIAHDEHAALYVHALFAIRDRKLGIIEANFISLPSRLLALIESEGQRIADDLERGALDADLGARINNPETVRLLNEELGGPNPKRADEVRRALAPPSSVSASAGNADDGARPSLARRLWPDLKLFLANGTGAFGTYATRLREGAGAGVPILSTVLAASEGLIGVSLDPTVDGAASYCLVPRAMFFELMPVSAAADENDGEKAKMRGGTLLPHEATIGRDYELIITNLAGLYRYRIGDVVRIAGFHHGAPLVEFQYRMGQLLNLRGEKLSEPQFERALASSIPPDAFGEYAVAEQTETFPPHYLVFVEPPPSRSSAGKGGRAVALSTKQLAQRLDEALCDESPVYKTWRGKRAIGRAEVRLVPQGGFESLRAVRLSEGASPQQLKVSRVLRDPKHAKLLSSAERRGRGHSSEGSIVRATD